MAVVKPIVSDECTTPPEMAPRASNRVLCFSQHCLLWLQAVLAEHHKAQVATRLYEQLRSQSPESLARVGLGRDALANEIHARLYGGQKRS